MAARPQFSLRWIFAVIALLAFLLAEAVVFPRGLAALVGFAVTSLMLTALGAGAIYARDYKRTFCIGALLWWSTFPALTGSFPFAGPGPAFLGGSVIDLYLLWLLAFAGGLAAVAVRRWARDPGGNAPPRSGDRL